ncbi:MAG: GGDEF domain-containing protein, partial [Solirubrobacterales bacterium]
IYATYFMAPRSAVLHVTFGVILCGGSAVALTGDGFSVADLQMLSVNVLVFGAMGAMVMLRRRAMLKAEYRARLLLLSDSLTGVANLRAIEEIGEELIEANAAAGTTFGLAVADLDGLKRVNTAFGHSGGDQLLTSFAECLKESARPMDQVGRTGGDEFVVLFPAVGEPELDSWASRYSSVVSKHNKAISGSQPLVSASVGTALFPSDGTTLDDLRRVADDRMYEQKVQRSYHTVELPAKETGGGRELHTAGSSHETAQPNMKAALAAGATGWLLACLVLLLSTVIPGARLGNPVPIWAFSGFCGLISLTSIAGRYVLTNVAVEIGNWAMVLAIAPAALITGGDDSPLVSVLIFIFAYAAYFLSPGAAIVQMAATLAAFSAGYWTAGSVDDAGETLYFNVVAASLMVSAVLLYNSHKLATANAAANLTALHDPLTGIANRHAFESDLQAAAESVDGTYIDRLRPSLIFIDLDNFKHVNTSLGHSGGDLLLRTVAERLRDAVADDGKVFRVGGDEFAVLASVRLVQDAAAIAERCRLAVSGAGQNIAMPVTASLGFAVWQESYDAHHLAIEADTALSQSKTHGKDTVSAMRILQSVDSAEYQNGGPGRTPAGRRSASGDGRSDFSSPSANPWHGLT